MGGTYKYTPGRLTKADLMINKHGKVVPRRRSLASQATAEKNGWAEKRRRWIRACLKVRQIENFKGFMKLKKNGTADEKRRYVKCVELVSDEQISELNSTLQQAGSSVQMTITRHAESVDATEPAAVRASETAVKTAN